MNEEARNAKLASLTHCKTMGEQAFDEMYDAHSFRDAAECYRDAKDFFYEAISLAGQLGLTEEAETLTQRLAHIKTVFRSQFSV
jgi:hypothetical protein